MIIFSINMVIEIMRYNTPGTKIKCEIKPIKPNRSLLIRLIDSKDDENN